MSQPLNESVLRTLWDTCGRNLGAFRGVCRQTFGQAAVATVEEHGTYDCVTVRLGGNTVSFNAPVEVGSDRVQRQYGEFATT